MHRFVKRKNWIKYYSVRFDPILYFSGAEIDLILEKGRQRLAIEIKASTSPEVKRSFWNALNDLKIDKAWIVAPVEAAYPYKQGVQVVSPHMLDLICKSVGDRRFTAFRPVMSDREQIRDGMTDRSRPRQRKTKRLKFHGLSPGRPPSKDLQDRTRRQVEAATIVSEKPARQSLLPIGASGRPINDNSEDPVGH